MKFRKLMIIIVLLVVILAAGLFAFSVFNKPLLKPNDNGSTVNQVKIGQEFTIVLSSNPTTGYEWNSGYDSQYIKLVNKEYQHDYPIRTGSGGEDIFTFKAIKSGDTIITLNYQRPWESKPIQTEQYEIKIS